MVISYNGDLRGVVEDALGLQRRVRVSVPTFQGLGAILEGSALLATVPALVARESRGPDPAADDDAALCAAGRGDGALVAAGRGVMTRPCASFTG